MQLIYAVLDKHMDEIMRFDGDLASFGTIAGRVFALSNAISGAMIGGDCTSFDEAVERVRAWMKHSSYKWPSTRGRRDSRRY